MIARAHTLEGTAVVLDVEAEEALRSAVGAATMLGPDRARALLSLSDEQLGHLFKAGIAQVIDLAGTITFGIAAAATRDRKPTGGKKRAAGVAADLERQVQAERRMLVADGKLLPAAQTWAGLGMTRQALSKAVASGRIFTVDVGAAQYYPAFYLAGDIDRQKVGWAVCRDGANGSSSRRRRHRWATSRRSSRCRAGRWVKSSAPPRRSPSARRPVC